MKQLLFSKIPALFAICIATVSYSQSDITKSSKKENMLQTAAKNEEILLSELNALFIKNFLTQDTVAHNRIIHKDFVCIEGSGEIVNRDQYIKNWATDYDNSGYKTFSFTDEVIRIFGDMALVRSKTIYTKIVDGKIIEGNSIYTDTYVKENGNWLCVQAHITPVKKK
ncbi:MAG: nuclear transport factor 2 family protein [Chitinophagaceae bacterium]|nr:nuclear transport factor 2 family protein [Chitinophagaceae bacterium]